MGYGNEVLALESRLSNFMQLRLHVTDKEGLLSVWILKVM